MFNNRVVRHVLILLALGLFAVGSVHAERQWAPGISGKKNRSSGSSNLWLRFGPSYGSFGDSPFDMTMLGLKMEFGLRPIKAAEGAKYQWSIELPFEISGFEHELDFDNFMLMGQLMPTVRVDFPTTSGKVISPYLGYGGGLFVFLSGFEFADDFNRIMTFRFGCDVMLNKSMGMGFHYSLGSIKTTVSYYDFSEGRYRSEDSDIGFDQLSLSMVFHP